MYTLQYALNASSHTWQKECCKLQCLLDLIVKQKLTWNVPELVSALCKAVPSREPMAATAHLTGTFLRYPDGTGHIDPSSVPVLTET